jgi:hypothetical protein
MTRSATQRVLCNQQRATFSLRMIRKMLDLFIANWPPMLLLTGGESHGVSVSGSHFLHTDMYSYVFFWRSTPTNFSHVAGTPILSDTTDGRWQVTVGQSGPILHQ